MKKIILSVLIIIGLTFNSYAAEQNLENLRDEIKSLEMTIEVYSSKLIKANADIEKKKQTLKSYQDNAPTVISIDKDGNYYISSMDNSIPKPISLDYLIATSLERIKARPEMKVFIRADKSVDYGSVIEIVAILKQKSNLENIGFMTDSSLAIKNEQEALKAKAKKVMARVQRKAEEVKAKEDELLVKEASKQLEQDQQNKDLLELESKILARSIVLEDQLNLLRSAYIHNIALRVKTFWRYQAAEDDWTAEVYVVQDRDGNVKVVNVRKAYVGSTSQGKSFMNSIERAVHKASPFPRAPDDAVFDSELYFIFSVN